MHRPGEYRCALAQMLGAVSRYPRLLGRTIKHVVEAHQHCTSARSDAAATGFLTAAIL